MVPTEIVECYREAQYLADAHIPYVFGGGHPDMHVGGGLDCSSAASRVLQWKAHILGSHEALDTIALEKWCDHGEGTSMTLWVINTQAIKHCVIEFKVPGWHKWFAGRHEGTNIGWLPYKFDPTGYEPRRWDHRTHS